MCELHYVNANFLQEADGKLTGLRNQRRCGLSHEGESRAMRTPILRRAVPRLIEIDSCTWESKSVKQVNTSLWYLRHFHGVRAPDTRSPGRLYGLVWIQNLVPGRTQRQGCHKMFTYKIR